MFLLLIQTTPPRLSIHRRVTWGHTARLYSVASFIPSTLGLTFCFMLLKTARTRGPWRSAILSLVQRCGPAISWDTGDHSPHDMGRTARALGSSQGDTRNTCNMHSANSNTLWHQNRRNKLCERHTPVHRAADIFMFPVTVGLMSVTRDYSICPLGLGAPTSSPLLETRSSRP